MREEVAVAIAGSFGGHSSWALGPYGAWFSKASAHGERGGRGNFAHAQRTVRKGLHSPCHGRRRWGLTDACGKGARGHRFAWEKIGKNEGKFASSPRRRTEAKMARFDRLRCGGSRWLQRPFLQRS